MNANALASELAARGFDYLSEARRYYFLNQAYLTDICENDDWPFLEAVTTSTAPITVSDLRSVESVVDNTQQLKLRPLRRKAITDFAPDLSGAGSPRNYFISGGDTINAWPANTTNSLTVQYFKVPSELASPNDTPVIPARWHYLIVEGAVKRAYEDDDEYAAAQAADQVFQTRLQSMRDSLLTQQHDRPDQFILLTNTEQAG